MANDEIRSKMAQNCVKIERVEYKKLVKFEINYGTADTEFGICLMGLHQGGICFLKFVDASSGLDSLKKAFPGAELKEDAGLIKRNARNIFNDACDNLIVLKGTEFEMTVWQELLNIRKGTTCCYEDVAKAIGKPRAVRAVANAIARNNVSYLVPCHRVISKDGSLNKYGGGADRKLRLLRYEKAM